MNIQQYLREQLDRAGITQAELARRMDVTPSHISQLLHHASRKNLTWATIERIAEALDSTVEIIFVRNDCTSTTSFDQGVPTMCFLKSGHTGDHVGLSRDERVTWKDPA